MMQASSGVPVAMASPLSRVDLSGLALTPEQAADIDGVAAAPIGLALPEPSGKAFNLLPDSVRIRAVQKRVQRYLIRAAAVIVVLMVGLTAMRYLQVNSAQGRLGTIQAQNATIQNVEIPKYDKAVDPAQSGGPTVGAGAPDPRERGGLARRLEPDRRVHPHVGAPCRTSPSRPLRTPAGNRRRRPARQRPPIGSITHQRVRNGPDRRHHVGTVHGQSPIFDNVDLSSGSPRATR